MKIRKFTAVFLTALCAVWFAAQVNAANVGAEQVLTDPISDWRLPKAPCSNYSSKSLTDIELFELVDSHKFVARNREAARKYRDIQRQFPQTGKMVDDHFDSGYLNLCNAELYGADFSNMELTYATLTSANLKKANFLHSDLFGANLRYADMRGALMANTVLADTDLTGANLTGAFLFGADLRGADLTGANLTDAVLIGADLTDAILTDTIMTRAFVFAAWYEPAKSDLNDSIADAVGIHTLRYQVPRDLLTLRNMFRSGGLNAQEREVTYAIKHGEQLNAPDTQFVRRLTTDVMDDRLYAFGEDWAKADLVGETGAEILRLIPGVVKVAVVNRGQDKFKKEIVSFEIDFDPELAEERVLSNEDWQSWLAARFNYVLFELTTHWGLAPGRALTVLVLLIPCFGLLYSVALWIPGKDGIWRVWAENRMRGDIGTSTPELIRVGFPKALLLGFYFSLMSAFHMGWRDFNIGNWIASVQSREYSMRASGWVRSLSGIQSLVSVYLLAMWVLTYFGRPFE